MIGILRLADQLMFWDKSSCVFALYWYINYKKFRIFFISDKSFPPLYDRIVKSVEETEDKLRLFCPQLSEISAIFILCSDKYFEYQALFTIFWFYWIELSNFGDSLNTFCSNCMVVRTLGKPGIHLEFENSTWKSSKTWNLHEKKFKKHLEYEIFQMNFYFAKILTKLWLKKVTKHKPNVAFVESRLKIHLEFYSSYRVLHLEIVYFSPGKPGI